jgi:hypothetical protein
MLNFSALFYRWRTKAACCEMIPETDEPFFTKKLVETKIITEFEEYGFVKKRLPVVKLAYDTLKILLIL